MKDKKTEKIEPKIMCGYQEITKNGLKYCGKSAYYEVDCPFISKIIIKEKFYSAIFKEKTLEVKLCEFDPKKYFKK